MFTIFEPIVSENYEWINVCDDGGHQALDILDGRPVRATWRPLSVQRVRADDRHDAKPSDFPWLGSRILIMRRRAVDALSELLDRNGEVLPLHTDDGVELYAFNARVIDALDEKASDVARFPGTNRIFDIKRAAFVYSAIAGVEIFRLPFRGSSTYVGDAFVERVTSRNLVGLEFERLWSFDEHSGS